MNGQREHACHHAFRRCAGRREAEVTKLHAKIGQFVVEHDSLGQKPSIAEPGSEENDDRPDHQRPSIRRQCELVSVSRASSYRQPAGESAESLELMRVIDEAFMETPLWGAPDGAAPAGASAASGSGG